MVKDGDFVIVRMTGWAYEEPTILEQQQGKEEPRLVMIETTEKEHAEREDFPKDRVSNPVFMIVGEKEFAIEGLHEALRDMEVGDEKEIELTPEKAYGMRDKSKIETIPSRKLREQGQWPVQRGQWIRIEGKVGKILSVGGGRVNIDFNHPHAGKRVKYWIKLEKLIEDETEKLEHLLKHYIHEAFSKEVTIEKNENGLLELKVPDFYLYQSPQIVLMLGIIANRLNKFLGKQTVRYIIEYSFITPETEKPAESENSDEAAAESNADEKEKSSETTSTEDATVEETSVTEQ